MGDVEFEVDLSEDKDKKDDKSNDKSNDRDKNEDKNQDGPPEGSKRWKEIYWQAQEGKRAIAERDTLKDELANARGLMKEMASHNERLADVLEGMQKGNDSTSRNAEVKKLEDKLVDLRSARKQAREKADYDSEDRLEDEIAEIRFTIKELKSRKADDGKKDKKDVGKDGNKGDNDDVKSILSEEDKRIYSKWLKDNDWIVKNPRARSMVVNVEEEVRGDPDFEMATEEELLEEIKVRMEEKLGPPESRVDSFLSGDKRSRDITKVKLTDVEMSLADGFGLDPKKVAEQKALISRSRKGRTTK